ncbi:sugar ABC transporter ATP-binding protein [filamentous cyanobacterium CCP2]|nr:sugar ABC transporter ATP-binding protein [filamentous cyanobacterium CCP2]
MLLGNNGSGKSTLLKILGGLLQPQAGEWSIEKPVGFVFQNPDHQLVMPTVGADVAFGLVDEHLPLAEIRHRVDDALAAINLLDLKRRPIYALSGGQKQRVALGRAMARNPQVFLMDEPLSNLDAKLRTETRTQIVNLQRKLGITTIYVTHDQTEAMTMGDRIAVMNAGQIQQVARPLELYNAPANRFVAEFIGSPPMNFIPVQVKAPLLIQHPQFRITLPEQWESSLKAYDGRSITLGIRPEHLSVSLPAPKNLPVQVERVEALGSETYLMVSLSEAADHPGISPPLQVRIEPDRTVTIGETLWLSLSPDKVHLFDTETGEAIISRAEPY